MIWLTPAEPVITVAGQRRDLTELPPSGSGGTVLMVAARSSAGYPPTPSGPLAAPRADGSRSSSWGATPPAIRLPAPAGSSVDRVRRAFGLLVLGVAVSVGACSTPVYTSGRAVSDLERQSNLTHTQATCIVDAIRKHFSDEIKAGQKANKGSPIPADDLKLQVDGALAALKEPAGSDEAATRTAILRCAPGALG